MPKPGGCHSSGISLGDVLRLPKRHPAWRRREAQSGSCMERENLAGDAKGKGTSGSNREVESTDAPERGGLLRSFLRIKARRGPKKAIMAVAASILTATYHMLKDGTLYQDLGSNHFQTRSKGQQTKRLVQRLADLGYDVALTPLAS